MGRLLTLAAAVSLAAAPGASSSGPALEDWRIDYERGVYPAAELTALVVVNPLGDVRLEGEPGEVVRATYGVQRHREDPRDPAVRVTETDGVLRLDVTFAELEIAEQEDWEKRRIDVALSVPEHLALTVRTVAGEIEVAGMEADVVLESLHGDQTFVGARGLSAHSEHGSVRARIDSTANDAPLAIETATGDIRLQLLEGARCTVELSTRGTVTTDFSIAIDRAPGSLLKRGRIETAPDGRAATLTSHQGAIRIEGLIVPEEAPEPADER